MVHVFMIFIKLSNSKRNLFNRKYLVTEVQINLASDPLYVDPISTLQMPHMSFLLRQLIGGSDMYAMRILPKMTCKETHRIETAGSKSDGTDLSIIHRDLTKHVTEYYSRYDAECPLMVLYPKSSFVECENNVGPKPPNKLRVEIDRRTHPGYCQLRYFTGRTDMRRDGHPVFTETNIISQRSFPGYHCRIWPSCATEWITRNTKTNWPPAEIKKKIEADGCLVIWRPHPSSKDPKLEWQFLFSNAEKVLFRDGLSQHQTYLYDVFKITVDYQSKHLEAKLHTVHVKSLFFYACESIQESMFEESPGGCFLFLIESLLESLRKRNLPNYFAHENNMIDHMKDENIQQLIGVIEALRVYPLQALTFLMGSKGYNRAWLVDVISKDFITFQNNTDMNRSICQLFFPTMIRYARKLALTEHLKDAYDKVEKSRLLLIMVPPEEDGTHTEVPNLDHLLRETLEPLDEYTKGLMAQTVDEIANIKLYTIETVLKKVKDFTGGVDIAGYGNIQMPIEFLGNPHLESSFLHALAIEQHNTYRNYENASKMYEAAIDHLEKAIEPTATELRSKERKEEVITETVKHAYETTLTQYYSNLAKAYTNLKKIENMRKRLPKLETLCKQFNFRKMVGFIMGIWESIGEPERGVQFHTSIFDSE